MKRGPASVSLSVLSLEVERERADALCQWITAALRVHPVQFERPGNSHVWIEAYFDSDVEAELAGKVLASHRGVLAVRTRQCEPKEWQSFWRHHFHAQDVGTRLHICPPWDVRADRKTDRLDVVIDPGLSFGTGDHFTTRFCLERLDDVCGNNAIASMLDVGTGSGILALAAARLGCQRVLAVDCDEQALDHARANAELNGLQKHIEWRYLDVTQTLPRERFDIVCANLYSRMLVECAPRLLQCAGRHLVLSGIREEEADDVAEAYLDLGCREIVRDGEGEWSGLVFSVT